MRGIHSHILPTQNKSKTSSIKQRFQLILRQFRNFAVCLHLVIPCTGATKLDPLYRGHQA
jgi:hypothetical protein